MLCLLWFKTIRSAGVWRKHTPKKGKTNRNVKHFSDWFSESALEKLLGNMCSHGNDSVFRWKFYAYTDFSLFVVNLCAYFAILKCRFIALQILCLEYLICYIDGLHWLTIVNWLLDLIVYEFGCFDNSFDQWNASHGFDLRGLVIAIYLFEMLNSKT